ncbi:hypothetical protein RB595_003618 [Gaeumannomyces hyphopodioides]
MMSLVAPTPAALPAAAKLADGCSSAAEPAAVGAKWEHADPVALTRQSVLDLLDGKIALIREPGFLSTDECKKYERELSHQVTPYKHNTGPQLWKVGVAQFEYQAQSQEDFANRKHGDEQSEYFKDCAQWKEFHRKLADDKGLDAWYRVFDRIAALFPDWDVEVATQGPDKVYFSGIYRCLNDSTYLHCDFSPYDSLTEDWIINSVERQIVFNLYLAPVKKGRTVSKLPPCMLFSLPEMIGVHMLTRCDKQIFPRTKTIWDVQWTPEALKHRDPNSYGYDHALVAGARKVVVEPVVGSLGLFNSRNMHEVEAVELEPAEDIGMEYRPRLTLSSFMGFIPAERTGGKPKLIFWS